MLPLQWCWLVVYKVGGVRRGSKQAGEGGGDLLAGHVLDRAGFTV